ncbi:AAA family ATPase [Paenibacillus farraposensis]|uniref:AAA family ATPase n=1 Tax=Paenibacillus farraposensis TaxID=2807095 RepID=A0ABW4DDF9_9BACL|nr:AAA family ATPase [Paenibacillus farraposensis]MCC3380640.1 AAA family ATPase [Paenibacillus farraposensis]
MNYLKININQIKNIRKAELELPLERGVYALVGINGSGKSTVLQALAQNISRHHLGMLNYTHIFLGFVHLSIVPL